MRPMTAWTTRNSGNVLNRWDSVGEGEGGMIWENGIETYIISYVKRVASPSSKHDTGCLGLVHRDHPEEWHAREEGSGWGTHVYLWQIHFDIWQN